MRSRYNHLAIYLDYGRKGAGKSLSQAKLALQLLKEYAQVEKKYPSLPHRILFSNVKFSKEIEEKELGRHLFYWENFKQMQHCPRLDCWKSKEPHPVHDADIQHDEIGKDFPAGSWTNTPKWVRQIFSHLRKRGNRYFANTQVYEDIDIAFRRQIDFAAKLTKICGSADVTATRPPIKHAWGIIVKYYFNPELLEWERDPDKRKVKADFEIPEIIGIRKKYIRAYDTHAELPPYMPDTLEHQELWCENDDCPVHGRNKGKPAYRHRAL